nr:hypothetical protein [Tanacetum cinerariifolium]
MVTHAKAGIFKPFERMNCHVTTTSPLPNSHVHALCDPNWKEAMLDEYKALITNETWVLVPRLANVNVVRSMWLFKHKFHADGSLSWYKARLVANGRSQQQGIDYDETFSPMVKPTTIRIVLSLAVTRDWPIHQLDVKNAFLHGQLSETIYMHQPPGFVDSTNPNYVCHLQCSLGSDIAYLLLYVDDIVLTASSTALLQRIIILLHKEILEWAHMQHCNPCKTLVDTESKLGSDGDPVSDPTLYRSLVDALHAYYAMFVGLLTKDFSFMFHPLVNLLPLQMLIGLVAQLPVDLHSGIVCSLVNLLSCFAKRQIQNLLLELHAPLTTATLVYCDNVSAVYLSNNPIQHQRTKHIEIDIHFVRDCVSFGQAMAYFWVLRTLMRSVFSLDLRSFAMMTGHSPLLPKKAYSR